MYKGLSVLPVSFFKDMESGKISITDWASMAKSIGISYIDIPRWAIRNHNPIYLCRLMKELELLGVSLGMIGTYSDFTNPDFMQRERELEYLKYCTCFTVGGRLPSHNRWAETSRGAKRTGD